MEGQALPDIQVSFKARIVEGVSHQQREYVKKHDTRNIALQAKEEMMDIQKWYEDNWLSIWKNFMLKQEGPISK